MPDNYRQGLTRLLAAVRSAVPTLMVDIATSLLPAVQAATPVASGELVNSEHVVQTGEGAQLCADAPHALWVHEDLQTTHTTGQAHFLTDPLEQDGPAVAATTLTHRLGGLV